jgi:hypothetical protein
MQIVHSTATFTRPEDTTQYGSGDLVANSTTNTEVEPMTFRVPGRGLKLWRVELLRSATTVTDAQFRLHLYKDSPTVANGDNGAISSIVAGYQGYIDIDGQAPAFTDDARAQGVPVINSVFAPMFIYTDEDTTLYGLLEARDTYTPASEEVFTVTLIGESYV